MKICSWHPALECIFSWKLVSGYLGGGDKTASSHSRSILRLMASSSFIIESKDSLCLKLHANGEKCFPCSKLSIHRSALEHSLLEIRDDRALQPGTSLTWFLLSQAWAECLKCKMNKTGYFCLFVLSEGEHSFIFHSLLHSLAEVNWAEVKQQEKKKRQREGTEQAGVCDRFPQGLNAYSWLLFWNTLLGLNFHLISLNSIIFKTWRLLLFGLS